MDVSLGNMDKLSIMLSVTFEAPGHIHGPIARGRHPDGSVKAARKMEGVGKAKVVSNGAYGQVTFNQYTTRLPHPYLHRVARRWNVHVFAPPTTKCARGQL